MTQQFWVPGPVPGMNEIVKAAKGFGGRGVGYSKLKKAWTETVARSAKTARLRPVKNAHFTFLWHEKRRNRDPDNVASAKKFILDGLVLAGVLENDGWDQVLGFSDTWTNGGGNYGVMVAMTTSSEWMP